MWGTRWHCPPARSSMWLKQPRKSRSETWQPQPEGTPRSKQASVTHGWISSSHSSRFLSKLLKKLPVAENHDFLDTVIPCVTSFISGVFLKAPFLLFNSISSRPVQNGQELSSSAVCAFFWWAFWLVGLSCGLVFFNTFEGRHSAQSFLDWAIPISSTFSYE